MHGQGILSFLFIYPKSQFPLTDSLVHLISAAKRDAQSQRQNIFNSLSMFSEINYVILQKYVRVSAIAIKHVSVDTPFI